MNADGVLDSDDLAEFVSQLLTADGTICP